mmetsp:Transcript_37630/g.75794  ORF Transcript_37630/g.75794 Transcript_37630/m.75794 type:complete len:358 (-) Transcript_37630:150-1223(-)
MADTFIFAQGLLRSGFKAVSLGAWCGVRGCLQDMGLHAESYPFDNMRISIEGVVHFLQTRFADFLKYERCCDMGQNEGRRLYNCKYHSFWHDNLDDPTERAKYERRTARFLKLHESAEQLLFVFACNASTEVATGEELLRSLFALFGQEKVWLLLLAGGQKEEKCWRIESAGGRLLVHSSTAREDPHLYRHGISAAIRSIRSQGAPIDVALDSASVIYHLQWYMSRDPRWSQYKLVGSSDEALDDVMGEQGTVWKVVAGGDKGIVVRSGRNLNSPELPRLSKGARVEEVELFGERLHYRKLEGTGPDWGWVSLTSKGARLLRPEAQRSLKSMKQKLLRNKVGRLMRAWLVAARLGLQ